LNSPCLSVKKALPVFGKAFFTGNNESTPKSLFLDIYPTHKVSGRDENEPIGVFGGGSTIDFFILKQIPVLFSVCIRPA
jgi:hypothetical protein